MRSPAVGEGASSLCEGPSMRSDPLHMRVGIKFFWQVSSAKELVWALRQSYVEIVDVLVRD